MFGRRHQGRRASNPIYILFRLILSIIIFTVLLAGVYSAYKHFSGLDPLKLDPQAVVNQLLGVRTPQQFLAVLFEEKLRLSSLKLSPKILGETSQKANQTMEELTNAPDFTSQGAFKFVLVSDSHNDNVNLSKAIAQSKTSYPAFIIGLGDYTNVGTLDELRLAKNEFDRVGLRYFLIAGDHDLWDSRDKLGDATANFKQVFGLTFQSFEYQGFKFLLLDNSDNYKGISQEQKNWITLELEKAKEEKVKGIFAFISEPLYHPSSDHYMGKVDKDLKVQAQSLIYQLKDAGVKKVFSGDIHYFSQFEEPITKLPMITVGALTTDRNPQVPRYTVVTVFKDGSTKVDDIEIK